MDGQIEFRQNITSQKVLVAFGKYRNADQPDSSAGAAATPNEGNNHAIHPICGAQGDYRQKSRTLATLVCAICAFPRDANWQRVSMDHHIPLRLWYHRVAMFKYRAYSKSRSCGTPGLRDDQPNVAFGDQLLHFESFIGVLLSHRDKLSCFEAGKDKAPRHPPGITSKSSKLNLYVPKWKTKVQPISVIQIDDP